MKQKLWRIAALLWMLGMPLAAAANEDVESVIAKARAYKGDEASLSAVESLVFVGTEEPAEGGSRTKYTAHLMRPLFQRVEQDDGGRLIITAVDALEGWMMVREREAPLQSVQVAPMDSRMYRSMRANTIANLYFFRGHDRFSGTVQRLDDSEIDGEPTVVLEYRFDSRSRMVRHFHPRTGRLMATEMEDGVMLREHGDQRVGGIRFPMRIDSYLHGELVGRMTIDEIQINGEIDLAIFRYPLGL